MKIKNLEKKIKNWVPDNSDFALGKYLIITEDYSKIIQGENSKDFHYGALLYSILSLREKFNQHKSQFNEFLSNDLFTADSILKNKNLVEKILKKYAFPNKKIKTVLSTAEKWNELNLTKRIRNDKEKKLGFKLREEMTEKMYGVGYKFASLFLRMSGYEKIVPIDSWATKYIESRGFKYRDEKSGLKFYQYIEYEKRLTNHAKKFRVSPALFQATIYAKFSTWKRDSGITSVNF